MLSMSKNATSFSFGNVAFFLFTGLAALITPWYLHRFGIAPVTVSLFWFYFVATGLAITMGYHRLFSHAAYKAHPLLRFILVFFGSAAFEQSVLRWASQHRDHHRYSDTDRDPYTVTKGFWHAHIGWMVWKTQDDRFENIGDLLKSRMLVHQHRHYLLWAMGSGVLIPWAIGWAGGDPWGALLVAVGARIALVQHSTFCINSICHTWGSPTYDAHSTSRDHWAVALLTFGEGYHNFHHRFPGDYRNGIRWFHWDPSKWVIASLRWVGLTKDLKRASYFRILHARIVSEKHRAESLARRLQKDSFMESLQAEYQRLARRLSAFEAAAAAYHRSFSQNLAHKTQEWDRLRGEALHSLRLRRAFFRATRDRWLSLINPKKVPA
jgi:stearoyl-CoA desaturase (delta-9 desaturase)